jgi:hypothetical protein
VSELTERVARFLELWDARDPSANIVAAAYAGDPRTPGFRSASLYRDDVRGLLARIEELKEDACRCEEMAGFCRAHYRLDEHGGPDFASPPD